MKGETQRRSRDEAASLLRVFHLARTHIVTADQPDQLLRVHVVAMGIAHVLLRHGTAIARKTIVMRGGRRTWF
jgi:hypothetical protein